LLSLLHQLQNKYGWRLTVAHLNHLLSEGSYPEASYVRQMCFQFSLSCRQSTVDVAKLAQERKLGIEEAGRHARYTFLGEVAREEQASVVVMGHQQDDQVEQFWLRLLRGSAPGSLGGIPQERDLAPGVRLVRPLLPFTRQEIMVYLASQGLKPFADPDNDLLRFRRNSLRHHTLPFLDDQHPGWRAKLVQTMSLLAEDEAYFRQVVEGELAQGSWEMGMYCYNLQHWQELPPPLRKRMLLRIFHTLQKSDIREELQHRHLLHLENLWTNMVEGKSYQLPGRRSLQRSHRNIFFLQDWPPEPWALAVEPPVHPGEVVSWRFPWSSLILPQLLYGHLDTGSDTTSRPESRLAGVFLHGWHLRSSQPGDCLLVRGHQQSIGELLRFYEIPLPQRAFYPLLLINDTPAAIPGLVVADPFRSRANDSFYFTFSYTHTRR
ncbi:MAG: tRNA lysidine(34) synthetase TilS, partial [Symbiobacteriaceae bacterium]|nr:tRNA lysidine(34) synthetase TilS [Symbiobacteriaceae bacterium]